MNPKWAGISGGVRRRFWQAAAGVTGFAVEHRGRLRLVPLVALSALAFGLGRAAGVLLASLL